MAKELARIKIDPDMTIYLQQLSYELGGLRVLNAQIIRSGISDDTHYRKFLEEYKEIQSAYNLAFDEVCSIYAPEYLHENITRMVNFLTDELVLIEEDAHSCTNCGNCDDCEGGCGNES